MELYYLDGCCLCCLNRWVRTGILSRTLLLNGNQLDDRARHNNSTKREELGYVLRPSINVSLFRQTKWRTTMTVEVFCFFDPWTTVVETFLHHKGSISIDRAISVLPCSSCCMDEDQNDINDQPSSSHFTPRSSARRRTPSARYQRRSSAIDVGSPY